MIDHKRTLDYTEENHLISGRLGVFASNWSTAGVMPPHTGNYIVAIKHDIEPVIGLYIQGKGWNLDNTKMIGLEEWVTHWMKLPETPEE